MEDIPVGINSGLTARLVLVEDIPVGINSVLTVRLVLVEDIGVEPMTSCVQGRRSSQLS